MGIAYLHGNGGSSGRTSLGFEIVGGTTRPAKPTQNLVWVNTNVDITGYAFSATEPTNPVEGMLLVTIANSSSIKSVFTVDKEWVTLYLVSVKQYIGGVWVDKSAMNYQNGVWTDLWTGELYTPGNEWKSVTGGWVCKENCGSKYAGLSVLAKTEIGLKVYTAPNYGGLVRCSNKIDVTNYDTLSVTATASCNIFVLSDLTLSEWNPTNMKAHTALSGSGTKTLDISALTGEFYIAIGHAVSYDASAVTFYITEVKMA